MGIGAIPFVASSLPREAKGEQERKIRGPLRVHPQNPRYFTDDGKRVVYLTGSHTWSNLQDMGPLRPTTCF